MMPDYFDAASFAFFFRFALFAITFFAITLSFTIDTTLRRYMLI